MSTFLNKPLQDQDRLLLQEKFLADHGILSHQLSFLAGDASFRTYYRITLSLEYISGTIVKNNKPHIISADHLSSTLPQNLDFPHQSLIFMDAPPPENPIAFVHIAQILQDHGFSAPKILATDLDKGFLLLEDFGDQTYTKILNADNSMEKNKNLYFLAIDTLIHLRKRITAQPLHTKPYTAAIHLQEAQQLLTWYYPAIYKKPPPATAEKEYQDLWLNHLNHLSEPNCLVLRDYHVDNLMVLKEQSGIKSCGIIDFQDALWGHPSYDLVSLLEDARRDISQTLQKDCWARYHEAFPEDNLSEFQREGALLSAVRHAKILGIFTRLAVRDGKMGYLHHIPRVWAYLESCLDHPSLQDLKIWFQEYFPERSIPHVHH